MLDLTFLDEVFLHPQTTLPVRFYYRLPSELKKEVEIIYKELSDPKIRGLDFLMYDISPDQYETIRDMADLITYYSFCEAFFAIRPIIEKAIVEYGLYDQYPEYLI